MTKNTIISSYHKKISINNPSDTSSTQKYSQTPLDDTMAMDLKQSSKENIHENRHEK